MLDLRTDRRDWEKWGMVIVGLLAIAVLILLAVAFVRPAQTAENARSSAALEAEMDRAEARFDAMHDKTEAQRLREF